MLDLAESLPDERPLAVDAVDSGIVGSFFFQSHDRTPAAPGGCVVAAHHRLQPAPLRRETAQYDEVLHHVNRRNGGRTFTCLISPSVIKAGAAHPRAAS